MTSGKRAKQARRQAATPPSPSRTGRRASPKVLAIAGGALAVVAAVIILVVALTGGNSTTPTTSTSAARQLPDASTVQSMFKGIPQTPTSLGKATAPVTMVEYLDLQCPFCRQFETEVLPDLIRSYVRTGKVRIEPRLVAFIGPDSVKGRLAAIAAAQQSKGSNFSQILYFNQGTENTGWLSDDVISAAAASIPGLDVARFNADRNSSAVSLKAADFDTQATADAVKGTPTILIGKTGGKLSPVPLQSMTDPAPVIAAIKAAQS
jgi:protein-disulfide isomerase